LFGGCCPVEGPADINVWPLFGPQAGGTQVTVTSSDLTDSPKLVIGFLSTNLDPVATLSTIATKQ